MWKSGCNQLSLLLVQLSFDAEKQKCLLACITAAVDDVLMDADATSTTNSNNSNNSNNSKIIEKT